MKPAPYYSTKHDAEDELRADGFVWDRKQAAWRKPGTTTYAKALFDSESGKYFIIRA